MSDLTISSAVPSVENFSTAAAKPQKAEETKAAEEKKGAESGAVFEKSDETKADNKGIYKINKMTQEERTALVNQLKADEANRQQQLTDMVAKMMGQQANTYGNANNIWRFLAEGKFEVDPETKAKAQEDISEDGYWGVKQTSQRMFDFASALAGDDPEKMKKMQEAMEKGYKQAEETWGKELPEISRQTMDAANKLFDDYFAAQAEA
ncbi:MAG: hypothetical protein K6F35_09750 [Lachnospiraceae bacterium]|nr:hypothetical protein [Lachnospiraceae bacterium]